MSNALEAPTQPPQALGAWVPPGGGTLLFVRLHEVRVRPGARERRALTRGAPQQYIESVESLAQSRQDQVQKLQREKKDIAWQLKGNGGGGTRAKFGEDFAMGGADLPPKLRAVMEDNRMLKDQVRKYKQKVSDQERSASTQQKQMLKLQNRCQKLAEALKETVTTGPSLDEEKLRAMVARSTQIIKELEDKLLVAEKSRDAEMKKGRVAMAGLRKQLTSKEDDLAALAEALKEKEMEMLKQGTKFRQALKRQQPVKKTIEQIKLEQLQLREAELEARLEDLSAVPPVEIVLNVVVSEGDREERDAPAEIEFEGTGEEEEAAMKIQAVYRGRCVREARKREEREEQEFAAMRIQSVYRGRAARNEVSARKDARRAELARIEEEEMTEAATKIQARFRGGRARAEFQERRTVARGEEEGASERTKGRSQRSSLAPTAPRQAPKGGRPNAARMSTGGWGGGTRKSLAKTTRKSLANT